MGSRYCANPFTGTLVHLAQMPFPVHSNPVKVNQQLQIREVDRGSWRFSKKPTVHFRVGNITKARVAELEFSFAFSREAVQGQKPASYWGGGMWGA